MKLKRLLMAVLAMAILVTALAIPTSASSISETETTGVVQPRAKLTDVVTSWEKVTIYQYPLKPNTWKQNYRYMTLRYVNGFSYSQTSKDVSTAWEKLHDMFTTPTHESTEPGKVRKAYVFPEK